MFEVNDSYFDSFVKDFTRDCESLVDVNSTQPVAWDVPMLVKGKYLEYLCRPRGRDLDVLVASDGRVLPVFFTVGKDNTVSAAVRRNVELTKDDAFTLLDALLRLRRRTSPPLRRFSRTPALAAS